MQRCQFTAEPSNAFDDFLALYSTYAVLYLHGVGS